MQGQRGPDGQFVPVQEVGPLPEGTLSAGFPLPAHGGPPSLPPRPSRFQQSYHGPRPEATPHIVRTDSASLAKLPPAQRSQMQRAPRTNPPLQFMVGPLLRYDTVDENGLWHGAALIVSMYLSWTSWVALRSCYPLIDSRRFGIFL